MAMCEKCWSDAFRAAMADTSIDQAGHYEILLHRRNTIGPLCTPKEQAGQWWDEELQRDSREYE